MSQETEFVSAVLVGLASLTLITGCGGDDGDDASPEEIRAFTDLVLTLLQAPGCAGLGEEIGDQIVCEVRNVGNKSFKSSFGCRVYIASLDPTAPPVAVVVPGGVVTFPNGIGANETLTFSFPGASISPDSPTGVQLHTIQADSFGEVSEDSDTNNFVTFNLEIFDPAIQTGCGGVVTSHVLLPQPPHIGVGPITGKNDASKNGSEK